MSFPLLPREPINERGILEQHSLSYLRSFQQELDSWDFYARRLFVVLSLIFVVPLFPTIGRY